MRYPDSGSSRNTPSLAGTHSIADSGDTPGEPNFPLDVNVPEDSRSSWVSDTTRLGKGNSNALSALWFVLEIVGIGDQSRLDLRQCTDRFSIGRGLYDVLERLIPFCRHHFRTVDNIIRRGITDIVSSNGRLITAKSNPAGANMEGRWNKGKLSPPYLNPPII